MLRKDLKQLHPAHSPEGVYGGPPRDGAVALLALSAPRLPLTAVSRSPVSGLAPPLPPRAPRLESHAVLMRAWPPVWGGSAAVHLINNLTVQFFRVNAAILFFTNWKRLVKPRDEWPFLPGMC